MQRRERARVLVNRARWMDAQNCLTPYYKQHCISIEYFYIFETEIYAGRAKETHIVAISGIMITISLFYGHCAKKEGIIKKKYMNKKKMFCNYQKNVIGGYKIEI